MFWPCSQQDAFVDHPSSGRLRIQLTSSDVAPPQPRPCGRPTYQVLEFCLHSDRHRSTFATSLLFCPHWPRHQVDKAAPAPAADAASSSSSSLSAAVDFLSVARAERSARGRGRTAVVDALGGTEAATFCALLTAADQLEVEGRADIYG